MSLDLLIAASTLSLVIGLASGGLSLLMSKDGPFGVLALIRRLGRTPLQCNVCRPAWLAVAMWGLVAYMVIGQVSIAIMAVVGLIALPASWGVAYIVTGLNGVMWD